MDASSRADLCQVEVIIDRESGIDMITYLMDHFSVLPSDLPE